MPGKTIEKCIRGAIVPLRRVAEDAGDGLEHDETIQLDVLCSLMQQLGAFRFRLDDFAHALRSQSGQRRVINNHCKMKNAAERFAD